MHLQAKAKDLTIEERNILQAKYSAGLVGSLNPDQLAKHTAGLLFKIHVITGWILPDDEYYMQVLADQLRKKLMEEYSDLTISEMEYAFRNFGTTVKDWGKCFNLNLFDTVMSNYRVTRTCISEYEERLHLSPSSNLKPSEEMVLQMRRELIEDKYQGFLQGKSSFVFLPEDGIDTLVNDKFCEDNLHTDFIENAKKALFKSYTTEIENAKASGRAREVFDLEEKIALLNDEENAQVRILSRKMALMYCFFQFKNAGYKNIYIQD